LSEEEAKSLARSNSPEWAAFLEARGEAVLQCSAAAELIYASESARALLAEGRAVISQVILDHLVSQAKSVVGQGGGVGPYLFDSHVGTLCAWIWTQEDESIRLSLAHTDSLSGVAYAGSGFSDVSNSLPQLVCVLDRSANLVHLNDRWTDYVGQSPSNQAEALEALHPEDGGWRELAQNSISPFEAELRVRRSDGQYRWHLLRAVPMRDGAGTVSRWLATLTDIDDRKEQEHRLTEYARKLEQQQAQLNAANVQLRRLAMTDALTGLLNKRAFDERLAEEVLRARRYGSHASLILVDVDRFKEYNDLHGHLAGDEVLRNVATVMKSLARSTDAVARYGGEEFVILLPSTGISGAEHLAERIRTTIESSAWALDKITVSAGVAGWSLENNSERQLLHAADTAMYEAKEAGRNCIRVYRSAISGEAA
jgi:diguanylate cyclase (GGDEF)-like protein/PAS domain S-box-containing protein